MLTVEDHWAALRELKSLQRYCKRTGEPLEPLIRVAPRQVEWLRRSAISAEESAEIEHALEFRELMIREIVWQNGSRQPSS